MAGGVTGSPASPAAVGVEDEECGGAPAEFSSSLSPEFPPLDTGAAKVCLLFLEAEPVGQDPASLPVF